MDDQQTINNEWHEAEERMRTFRFFAIDGKRQQGDRFLQPWLFGHVYASGSRSRGEKRRASKELKRFFDQKELLKIMDDAGEYRDQLMEAQLYDSADKYLEICRDDDGFGRKMFGLMRMKADEKEDKIIRDVYVSMIPLLFSLENLDERFTMIKALDQACRTLYPQRLEDMKILVETMPDESIRSVLPEFEERD